MPGVADMGEDWDVSATEFSGFSPSQFIMHHTRNLWENARLLQRHKS